MSQLQARGVSFPIRLFRTDGERSKAPQQLGDENVTIWGIWQRKYQRTLAEMVRAMSKLTESNEVLTKTNAALAHQVTVLQKAKGPNNPRNPRNGAGVGPPKEKKLCPNCKQEVFHSPSDFFELTANAAKRPNNWVTRM